MSENKVDQLALVQQYAVVVLREVYRNRYIFSFGFAIISISIVGMGLVAPKTFSTSATLYADQSNIIKPLLSGQAATTRVQDQTRVVKETIYSPSVMSKVVEQAGILTDSETPAQIEQITNRIRSGITVTGIGGSYIKVEYKSTNQDKTFNVLKAVINVFLKESSDAKRSESRQAYEFINSQVESYKTQLQTAEQKLRDFKANSLDGTEANVNARIANLRNAVESLKLDIEGVSTRVSGIDKELGKESQFAAHQHKLVVYKNSLGQAEQELATLLLGYTDDHPDVVALRFKIEDLKRAIVTAGNSPNQEGEVTVNPLYEELRAERAEASVELQAKTARLASTQRLLVEEHERLKRVAESQAELSELTRDYNVTRGIYEDMLERKERARLSMTLDIEGRGLNYKVQEPPAYPLNPTGIRFLHFVFISPLVGAIIPVGIIVGLVLFGSRIRFSSALNNFAGVELLGEVSHTPSPLRSRLFKKDVFIIGLIMLCLAGAYALAIYYKLAFGQ